VYLCDSNVWLALALSDHVHHGPTREWLESVDDRIVCVPEEPPATEAHWKAAHGPHGGGTKAVDDAYLAAFAISGSLRLVTTDTGFVPFKDLDLVLVSNS
jgi:uncharacterized protein